MQKFTSLSIVLILWFAGLCAAAQFAKIGHVLPELQTLYPNAGYGIGFLVSSVSLMGALLGVIAGFWLGALVRTMFFSRVWQRVVLFL